MHRYYCTYFDRNYLLKALSLIASLNRHLSQPFTLYAVCLDELTRTVLERLALPNVVTIPLHQVEENDAELLAAKKTRSCVEYYWTLTPSIMLWVLDRHPEIELITYLDADLYFYADSEPIFQELGDNSTLIHGHRFPEYMKHLEIYGKYNVGLLCFRRDQAGLEVLRWWRERCNEWCYCTIDNGRYGDQLYLDDWTERFRKVHVLEHIGAGVAPWNHIQYRFRAEPDGKVCLDDREVIFYHFHSLDFVRPGLVIPAKFLLYPLREDIITNCVVPYLEELRRSMQKVLEILPGFSFGLFNDRLLSAEHTLIAEKSYGDELKNLGLAHPILELSNGWQCHCSEQMNPPAPPYERQTPLQKRADAEKALAREPSVFPKGGTMESSAGSARTGAEVRACGPELLVKKPLPRITLVTPSYNYGRYLEACLDSALSQNYPDLEYIVMDGGSTDDSVRILKRYEKHLSYWQSRPDAGQYSAIEEGFRRSTGELMTWLNADDMFHKGAFDTVASIFSAEPETQWLMGRPNSFDEEGRQKHVLSFLPMNSRAKYLEDQELIQQEGVFWRRPLWDRSGGYLDRELLLAADLELWARFFRSAQLLSVDTLIAGFRDHPLQKSKDKAAYTAEANRVLARERKIYALEKRRFSPPAPLPFLVQGAGAAL